MIFLPNYVGFFGQQKCHLPCGADLCSAGSCLLSPQGDTGTGRITVSAARLSSGMRRGLLFVGMQGGALRAVSPFALRWTRAGRRGRNASARRFPGKGDDCFGNMSPGRWYTILLMLKSIVCLRSARACFVVSSLVVSRCLAVRASCKPRCLDRLRRCRNVI